jgi:putative PEP-CTERM system TPR-repeat lipoprotein
MMKKNPEMSRNRFVMTLRHAVLSAAIGLALAGTQVFAGESVDKARAYMETGDNRAAIIELKNALQEDPGDAEARLLLGELYLRLKDGAGAEKEIRRASELGADPSTWKLNLIQALVLQGKFSDALDRLDGLPEQSPKDQSRAMALRGQANMGLKQVEDAANDFKEALRLDPDNETAGLGQILLELAGGELEPATAATDQFLARFPDNVEALIIRAELHRNAEELDEAGARFARVIELEPQNVRALMGHATVMIAVGDLEKAQADLDLVDDLQKDLAMAHYLRGVIAFQGKDWEKSEEHLQKVLNAIPGHLQSQLLLGIIS